MQIVRGAPRRSPLEPAQAWRGRRERAHCSPLERRYRGRDGSCDGYMFSVRTKRQRPSVFPGGCQSGNAPSSSTTGVAKGGLGVVDPLSFQPWPAYRSLHCLLLFRSSPPAARVVAMSSSRIPWELGRQEAPTLAAAAAASLARGRKVAPRASALAAPISVARALVVPASVVPALAALASVVRASGVLVEHLAAARPTAAFATIASIPARAWVSRPICARTCVRARAASAVGRAARLPRASVQTVFLHVYVQARPQEPAR